MGILKANIMKNEHNFKLILSVKELKSEYWLLVLLIFLNNYNIITKMKTNVIQWMCTIYILIIFNY